jgi:SEC-C motif-containing protein
MTEDYTEKLCPCGSSKNYVSCCKFLHDGLLKAATAEALMRSRYSAYVFKLRDYLLKTWHEDFRPKFLNFEKDLEWLSLEVIDREKGLEFDDEGYVEFKVFFKKAKKRSFMQEKSYFKKIASQWLYLNGV